MYEKSLRSQIAALEAYAPGLSIEEIQQKYGLSQVIKMASNENPLGTSPMAAEAIRRHAAEAFRYPRGGNPRLVRALADSLGSDSSSIVVGNGSDEIIDMLIRMLAEPGRHNVTCFSPCFSLYPIQAGISGVMVRRVPLNDDFSFDFAALLAMTDADTRLVFTTMPDNPSGFCPKAEDVLGFASALAQRAPQCLLVIDEAYIDFADDEKSASLWTSGRLPSNAAVLRTFSKSYGLAGLRLGFGILPQEIADAYWRARLPFSVNILAEEAALAALRDTCFREATFQTVREGRSLLTKELRDLGCTVWPSQANFLLFKLPEGAIGAADCFEALLRRGIIIRRLKGYGLPDHLRVSIGNRQENAAFLAAMREILTEGGRS
ncbi:MAG: histidinol-phosphate transaminase [Desulfovibrio sp.]|nr:histidinol-phosphate transaminase [Desulfovibrio sp.]